MDLLIFPTNTIKKLHHANHLKIIVGCKIQPSNELDEQQQEKGKRLYATTSTLIDAIIMHIRMLASYLRNILSHESCRNVCKPSIKLLVL